MIIYIFTFLNDLKLHYTIIPTYLITQAFIPFPSDHLDITS